MVDLSCIFKFGKIVNIFYENIDLKIISFHVSPSLTKILQFYLFIYLFICIMVP